MESLQRQLWEQPFSTSFRQLAEPVPALQELDERIRRDPDSLLSELTFRDTGRIGGPPPVAGSREGRALILVAIQKAVKRLVGPDSGLADPVLASAAAERAAFGHLREAAGIGPLTGGPLSRRTSSGKTEWPPKDRGSKKER